MTLIHHTILALALLLPAPAVLAQHGGHAAAGQEVSATAAWARASAGAARTGAAYLTLKSAGTADRLVSASTPAAGRAELHTHVREGDVMRMRPVKAIDVPARGKVELKPGGLHIMLMDLKAPLKQGDSFPLTLQFEKAGSQTVTVAIEGVGASGPAEQSPGGASHAH